MALEAIKYDETGLLVLNQLLLPGETHYEEIKSVENAWDAIKTMKVQQLTVWIWYTGAQLQSHFKVTGYSLLINVHEKNITFLFFVQDPGMHAFNFTAKKSCISL